MSSAIRKQSPFTATEIGSTGKSSREKSTSEPLDFEMIVGPDAPPMYNGSTLH